jgi:acetyltransferase
MNDLKFKLNMLSGAHRPDFAQYPAKLKSNLVLKAAKNGGQSQILRPIRPEDEPAMRRFHALLSEETVYERYFEHFTLEGRIDHQRLSRICTNSPDSIALVVERQEGSGETGEILAVGRLTTLDEPFVASFAVLVRDDARDQGFDAILLERLTVLARSFGFKLLTDDDLVSNHDLLNLCKKSGFTLHTIPDEGLVRVCLTL